MNNSRSRLLLLVLALTWVGHGSAADANLLEQGKRAYQAGSFSAAAVSWEKAVEAANRKGATEAEIDASLLLASAYQSLGQQRNAVALLDETLLLAEKSGAKSVTIIKGKLGAALILTRETDRARYLLQQALESARASKDANLTATILNDLGNLLAVLQAYPEASSAYSESITLARQAKNSFLTAQALCNSAAAASRGGNFQSADEQNALALQEIAFLEESHAKAFLLLTAGLTDLEARPSAREASQRIQLRAHQSFRKALEFAEKQSDKAIETYAVGYLGQMYELDRQPESALKLTRRASFVAQEAQMPEALYRWERQLGRLLKASGQNEQAIQAYRRAVQTLQSIRNDVSIAYGNSLSYRSFRESEGPLFLELADLLLEKSKSAPDPAAEQALLLEARDTVEQLKSVELQSYFCDDCMDVQQSKSRTLEAIDKNTAVIYLIPLPTRTEVLVGLNSGLKRFEAPVGAEALTAEVRQFRRNLETRTSYEYLSQAEKLYSWLIQPIRPLLAANKIDTLVIVPDGAVRTIPFAALHNGEDFLIKEFAVATAPGLSMIDPKPIQVEKARMLLNGVSDSVQGYDPLNFVRGELQSIEQTYPSETLLNESFTLSTLKKRLAYEQYSIVHIASHGQFDRDVRKTFVLTHDTKLTLNDLEALIRPSQYRGRPVELLVLSACQTAAGDDRAALGLAGVAVKAGARSAMATLWFVNDESTSALVTEVYHQLQGSGKSKAKAVQAAQLKLLEERRYRHPCYWSPYLLIGNWL